MNLRPDFRRPTRRDMRDVFTAQRRNERDCRRVLNDDLFTVDLIPHTRLAFFLSSHSFSSTSRTTIKMRYSASITLVAAAVVAMLSAAPAHAEDYRMQVKHPKQDATAFCNTWRADW
jgi:hypothetical protein